MILNSKSLQFFKYIWYKNHPERLKIRKNLFLFEENRFFDLFSKKTIFSFVYKKSVFRFFEKFDFPICFEEIDFSKSDMLRIKSYVCMQKTFKKPSKWLEFYVFDGRFEFYVKNAADINHYHRKRMELCRSKVQNTTFF